MDAIKLQNPNRILIPKDWTLTDSILRPTAKTCPHRYVSYKIQGSQITITIHCALKQTNCTILECQNCTKQNEATNQNIWRPKLDTPSTPVIPIPTSWLHVSDSLEITLPPPTETDRKIQFKEDGSIIYEDDGNWEPPRNINGYQRDPENSLRFLPLWPPCSLRHQQAIRYANCGCINVKMICNNPECNLFIQEVFHNQCTECKWRKP